MKILIFFSKSKNTRTKNTRTRPEVQKYSNGFYTSIPKYPKIRNTRSEPERVPERPPLLENVKNKSFLNNFFQNM